MSDSSYFLVDGEPRIQKVCATCGMARFADFPSMAFIPDPSAKTPCAECGGDVSAPPEPKDAALLKEYGDTEFVKALRERLNDSDAAFVIRLLQEGDYCGRCFDKGPWCGCCDSVLDYDDRE